MRENVETMNLLLIKVETKVFSRYFATYRKNIWFRTSWNSMKDVVSGSSDCFWLINNNEIKVAGVILSKNAIGPLFMIPPFNITFEIVEYLKAKVLEMSGETNLVIAKGVLSDYIDSFVDASFQQLESRSCMIRPTEQLALVVPHGFSLKNPKQVDISIIS